MLDKWNVFITKDYVGVLIYDTETKMFSFDYKGKTERAEATRQLLNWDKDPKWFKETLFDRVCPPNRVDIDEILQSVGLKEYDAWELIKCAHLSSVNDTIWMQKGMDPNKFYTLCIYGSLAAEQDGVFDLYWGKANNK